MNATKVQNSIDPVSQQPLPPNTTLSQDKTLQGQRNVNIVWEVTQAAIALTITIGVVVVAVHNGLSGTESIQHEFPAVLSNAFFLIVGFYFSRTNHQAIGGVGPKPNLNQEYEGR